MTDGVLHDYIAGAVGGSAGLLVGYPFDTTKVKLQTQHVGKGASTMATAANIFRQGLSNGFFRGVSWPLMSYGGVNAVFFGVYGNTLKLLEKDKDTSNPSVRNICIAGCVGGAAQLIPVIPVDHIKVVLQSQISQDKQLVHKGGHGRYFKGPLQCASHMYKTKGIQGLYKGGSIMFCRDVPSFTLYILIYEILRKKLKEEGQLKSRAFLADFIAGGLAGSLSWCAIMPLDVIKSRFQADLRNQYTGLLNCAIKSYKTEGLRVFYKGVFVTCCRAFPVNAVALSVYSQVLQYLNEIAAVR